MTDDDASQPSDHHLTDFQRARAEAAELLGLDTGRLSPGDSLRLDLAVVLRRVVDTATEDSFSGTPIDIPRLMTAIERLTQLLPALQHARREDPRKHLLEMILEQRERRQIADRAVEPSLRQRVTMLETENASLRNTVRAAGLATITPSESDVTPPNDQSDRSFYRGPPREAPDDHLAMPRTSRVIEHEAMPDEDDAVDLVATYAAPDEPWREFVQPDGSISSVPVSRGKFWGPV
jgi:Trp operon repressor